MTIRNIFRRTYRSKSHWRTDGKGVRRFSRLAVRTARGGLGAYAAALLGWRLAWTAKSVSKRADQGGIGDGKISSQIIPLRAAYGFDVATVVILLSTLRASVSRSGAAGGKEGAKRRRYRDRAEHNQVNLIAGLDPPHGPTLLGRC